MGCMAALSGRLFELFTGGTDPIRLHGTMDFSNDNVHCHLAQALRMHMKHEAFWGNRPNLRLIPRIHF